MEIDLEQPLGECLKDISRLNADGNNAVDRNSMIVSTSADDEHSSGPTVSARHLNGTDKSQAGDVINLNTLKNLEPHDGMEFESKEEAFSHYREYAKSVGFAVIIKASRRSKASGNFIDAKFACTRYGNKRESETLHSVSNAENLPVKKKRGRVNLSWSKTDCKAYMHVKRNQCGRWVIRSFIKEHNHDISPDQAYYPSGNRKLDPFNNKVDASTRLRAKNMYVDMSRQSGTYKNLESQKTVKSAKHLALEDGDAQVMLDHFVYMQDENPNFFYAIDLNEELRLRNVFWVDSKARLNYESFSDAVFFDTTYIKSDYKLPFLPFIGVNHHFQFILLGCALVADETKATYAWLMRVWLKAMGGRAPNVLFTDQDRALKEALAEIFPHSRHCFCLWHVFNKIPEKLSYVMKQNENFMTKFKKCVMRSWKDEEFEKRWWKIVDRFDLRNDKWFQSLYEDRERWVPMYMRDVHLAGMSTAQRSDSVHSLFDKLMHRKTSLKEFLGQYQTILQKKHDEEAKADFESWHKQPGLKSPSPFGKQMSRLYTHEVFKKFQFEVLAVVACHPRQEREDGSTKTFRVQDFEENHDFTVVWNQETSDFSCSCRLFEYNGFLCRHVMVVLQMSSVHNIPPQYILKRWTKDAKSKQTSSHGPEVVESRVQRYNDLCRRAFKLGDEGSLSQETYNIAYKALEEALRKCESVNNPQSSSREPCSPTYGPRVLENVSECNNTSNSNKKNNSSNSSQVHLEPEAITIGIHDSWQQMEQLNSRTATIDGYFGSQPMMQGMGHLNSLTSGREDYYHNQHNIQGLGQLNFIAPIHGTHYMSQQRIHGMAPLQFRPQTVPSCFDVQDSLQDSEPA